MARKHNDIHVELYNISHNCSLCGYYMGRISESVCEKFDYSDTDSQTFDTKNMILVCKDCSVRRRKRNIRGYVDKRFAELTVELAIITELRRNFSKSDTKVTKSYAEETAKVDALVDDWDEPVPVSPATNAPAELSDTALAKLDQTDPRLDPESSMFDAALYDRWLTL